MTSKEVLLKLLTNGFLQLLLSSLTFIFSAILLTVSLWFYFKYMKWDRNKDLELIKEFKERKKKELEDKSDEYEK